jgi:HAD superfamily hydrolase (TIGR01549 family)
MPMETIRYVLFDLDGTLVDSPIDFDGIRKSLGITKAQDILGYLEQIKGQDEDLFKKSSDIVYQYELEASKKVSIFDGVIEFLEFLKQQEIPMGVVTRNCREIANVQMKSFHQYFEHILTRDDVEKPKPHPESFLFFQDRYQFKATQTLFIGNHMHDYEFAQNNNLKYLEFVPSIEGQKNRSFEFQSYTELKDQFLNQQPEVFPLC